MQSEFIRSLASPAIMGIVNVTPDSFSDGGKNLHLEAAVSNALTMVKQGADILDIGGESTRPGAKAVTTEQELQRVIPIIERIRQQSDIPISIDTSKPEVMEAALQAGATMINDVNGLRAPGAIAVASQFQVPVCVMHMQGEPRTMQLNPQYQDVVEEVKTFFLERVKACVDAGVQRHNIIFDPGFGFGKTIAHNYRLFNAIPELIELGYPVLIGVSRKSMLGNVTDKPVEFRLASSVAAATLAAHMGAHILRVHDVDETVDAVKIVNACKQNQ